MLKRLGLFPDTTQIEHDRLQVGAIDVLALSQEYGTPLYLYDRATMDAAVATYRHALKVYYPSSAEITYAGKAFLCRAVAEWIRQQDLWADCTGEGEIHVALSGNVPRESIVVHGVNKSHEDVAAALKSAGTIVVDNEAELENIARREPGGLPNIWLRLLPGLAVATHHIHTQTGQHGSKFGMPAEDFLEAVQTCKKAGLPLNGVHFHQGSNFRDPAPLVAAIELALDLVKKCDLGDSWHFSPGGGWSVAYHEDELPQPNIDSYVRVIAQTVIEKCRSLGLALPVLHLEPGRSLIARAGVAVYRVGVVKESDDRTWLLLDGGMADNPRHALYGARYSCLPATALSRAPDQPVSIAGPYCESGDVLIEDLAMPRIEPGEVVAIPASGAYQLSMSNNYNGARRPAVVWLQDGRAQLIVRRETLDDLTHRDLTLGERIPETHQGSRD